MTEGPRLRGWDTDFFGFPVAEQRTSSCEPLNLIHSVECARRLGATLLVVKVPHGTPIVNGDAAFLADTQIKFEMPCDRPLPVWRTGSAKLEPYDKLSLDGEMAQLGILAGIQSRFFQDPGFPRAAAEALYVKWMERIVSREFSDRILVLVERDAAGRVCAMGASYIDAAGKGIPSLMAMNPNQATPGFGRAYFSAMMRWFRDEGVHKACIKTQERSHAARNLYDRAGWVLAQRDDIYHVWLAKPAIKITYG